MGDMLATVTFTNNSSTHSFKRDIFGLFAGDIYNVTLLGGLVDIDTYALGFSVSPALTMGPNDSETMTVDTTSVLAASLEDIVKSAFNIVCVWIDEGSAARFGVLVHVPVQILGIGTRPSWYVMHDNAAPRTPPNWIPSGDDPSDPFSWGDFSPSGLSINAVPESDHSSLAISIDIDDEELTKSS